MVPLLLVFLQRLTVAKLRIMAKSRNSEMDVIGLAIASDVHKSRVPFVRLSSGRTDKGSNADSRAENIRRLSNEYGKPIGPENPHKINPIPIVLMTVAKNPNSIILLQFVQTL